jgi:hypothetical protein
MGLIPVQLAPAVIKKASAMVAMKPQSISCACHATPPKGAFKNDGVKIHNTMATSAQPTPAKYRGLKASSRKTFMLGATGPGKFLSGGCVSAATARMGAGLGTVDMAFFMKDL